MLYKGAIEVQIQKQILWKSHFLILFLQTTGKKLPTFESLYVSDMQHELLRQKNQWLKLVIPIMYSLLFAAQ